MRLSYTLVFFQFLFLGLLFWPVDAATFEGAWILSALLFHLALILLLWIMMHNRIGNYNIIPEIKEGASLIKTGPYRFVRHPMYSAVILIAVAVFIYWYHPYKIALLLGLVLTLFTKAAKEEKLWSEKMIGYRKYKKITGMFFPFLFKK